MHCAHCAGARGSASVVWHVTLKYVGVLIGRQCESQLNLPFDNTNPIYLINLLWKLVAVQAHCACGDCGKSGVKNDHVSDRRSASEDVHACSWCHCHGHFYMTAVIAPQGIRV